MRALSWIASSGILAILIAWRGAIWYSERAPAFDGTPLPACGPGSLQPAFQRAVAESRDEIQALMAERRIPGLTIAAMANGELAWSEGFGWADRDSRRPACPETVLRIASLSKPLTAALLARLHEQGRLRLDDSVYAYVPDFPPQEV